MAGPSLFLSCGDGYVGELLELPQGCQGPFGGSRGKVGFLSRCCSRKGPHLALRGESPGFSRVVAGNFGVPLELRRGPQGPAHVASEKSSLHASCEGPLGIPLQSVLGSMSLSGVEAGTSVFFSGVTWISVFLWNFKRGPTSHLVWRQASPLSS